jgi:hypothetical protein
MGLNGTETLNECTVEEILDYLCNEKRTLAMVYFVVIADDNGGNENMTGGHGNRITRLGMTRILNLLYEKKNMDIIKPSEGDNLPDLDDDT